MVPTRSQLLACLAVVATLLSTLPLVQAAGRTNPRDFPDSTFCPFNLGFLVDPVNGNITPTTRPSRLPFTAEKTKALITLVACDRGLTGDHPAGLDIAVRTFAVVREDIYNSHQRINTDPNIPFSCNISQDGNAPFANTVGSVFDPGVAPAVSSNSKFVPFFDDFSNLTASNRDWRLDGSTLETLQTVNDPIDPVAGPANALILARGFNNATADSCSSASVQVGRLKVGTRYVVDFRWSVSGILGDPPPPEVDMLTFVDTQPKE
jgi:hypothetical protein